MTVRVRIAPSPTGDPHVGTAYMALFNLLYARRHNGQFILRIEDTDQTRSRPEYEKSIFDALNWCGITWDEGPDVGGDYGPYRQSERTEIYREHCTKLLVSGHAYKCFCTAEELAEAREISAKSGGKQGYNRQCRNLSTAEIEKNEAEKKPYTVRLKVPLDGECLFEDAIKKDRVTTPWKDVDDQVLMKSDNFPTYHLANVVDDHLMKITHVIRGDEWMSSTPKHVLLYQAFGWEPPVFMHMPLLLGKDRKKLSKRRNPTSIFFYRDSGYLPEAFLNFLTLMGYSVPGDKEIYTVDEIGKHFDSQRLGVSGAIFDVDKLDWINQQYLIKKIPEDQLWQRLKEWQFNDAFMQKLMPLVSTRIKTFGEFMELCSFFFINNLTYTQELLCPKEMTPSQAACMLQAMIWHLEKQENWKRDGMRTAALAVAETFGLKVKGLMPILFGALMGKKEGPPFFDSAELLGKERTRARFLKAMEFLGGVSNKMMSVLKKGWDAGNCQSLMKPTSKPA